MSLACVQGIYDGCKVAVKLAHQMAGYTSATPASPPTVTAPPPEAAKGDVAAAA